LGQAFGERITAVMEPQICDATNNYIKQYTTGLLDLLMIARAGDVTIPAIILE
jgi:hypothetical protein